jgi:hypothetical protein
MHAGLLRQHASRIRNALIRESHTIHSDGKTL